MNAINEAEQPVKIDKKQLDNAINALRTNKFQNSAIADVAGKIFKVNDKDYAILPTSSQEEIEKRAKAFVDIAIKAGVTKKDEKELDSDLESETKSKKQEFIKLLVNKIMANNKVARNNSYLDKLNTKLEELKRAKNTDKDKNVFKRPDSVKQLVKDYKEAGMGFVAHTCRATYKLLSNAEKDSDLKKLAQSIGKEQDSNIDDYLKDISDINERKHVDSGACALALAVKYREADKSRKSPYSAKSTTEAIRLADKYKKEFPKYYTNSHNLLSDAYKEGMAEAQKKLRNGESLTDPLSGEEVNKKLFASVWKVGSKMNKFFSNEPLNVFTLGPKIIFGVFNALSSKTAKDIYSNVSKFGRAIAQRNAQNAQAADNAEQAELFSCDVDTLKKEFDDLVKQKSEEPDEEDNEE